MAEAPIPTAQTADAPRNDLRGVLVIESPILGHEALQAVKDRAAAYRPAKWETDLIEAREQYEGEVYRQALAAVQRRFRVTGSRMPVVSLPWVSTIAFKGSTIYDEPTTRELLDAAGNALSVEGNRAVADFERLLTEAQLDAVMPEFDRVRYVAKSALLYVYSDSVGAMSTGQPPKTKAAIVWPQDVYVVPHPHAPTDLQAALRVLWRTGDDAGPGRRSYVDWYRDRVVDETGRIVAFGAWKADRVTEIVKGKGAGSTTEIRRQPIWAPYPLRRLPFVVAHKGIASGRPFLGGAGTLKDTANTLNAGLTSEQYTVDMCAAPILTHTTNDPQKSQVAVGPGVLVKIRAGETLNSVTQTADLAGIRAASSAALENLALTERQRPGSFTGDAGGDSGIALKVRSIPAEKARREDKAQLRPFEEEELMPLLIEVHDHFRATSIAVAAPGGVRVNFPDPPDFETKQERQDRAVGAADAGLISKARAAVEAGWYATEAEAVPALQAIAAEKAARMVAAVRIDTSPSETADPGMVDDPAAMS